MVSCSEPVPSPNGWHKRILATREVTSPGGTVSSVSDEFEVDTTPPGESKEAREARMALARQRKRRCLTYLEKKLPVVAAAPPKLASVRCHRTAPAIVLLTLFRCLAQVQALPRKKKDPFRFKCDVLKAFKACMGDALVPRPAAALVLLRGWGWCVEEHVECAPGDEVALLWALRMLHTGAVGEICSVAKMATLLCEQGERDALVGGLQLLVYPPAKCESA